MAPIPARRGRPPAYDTLIAAAIAATVSGVPSSLHALATGTPLLDSTRAAGTLLGRPTIPRGLVAHAAISLGWTVVLARALPQKHRVAAGALAGAAIAALDLGIVARRVPAIRALPQAPQRADHILFGATVAAVLD
jgi:hypothetical protein